MRSKSFDDCAIYTISNLKFWIFVQFGPFFHKFLYTSDIFIQPHQTGFLPELDAIYGVLYYEYGWLPYYSMLFRTS